MASLLFLVFIGSALYVFGIPPFNPGGPLLPAAEKTSGQQATQEMPAFLSEEKIGRAKTYAEYMNRGKLLEDNSYHALAVAEYEAAVKQAPENIEPLIEIGRIHLREKDYIKSKLSFLEALRIEPANLDANIYLVRALLADRKITEAQKVISTLTESNQNSKYYEGIIAAYFGDYENSKSRFNDAISIGTSDDITAKARDFLAAYDEYDFNQGGSKVHIKTLLARSMNRAGEYNMAIPLLFEVIKEKKDYRDAWILLGYAYLRIEKFQDAIEALEEAKKLDPAKPETLFYLGLGYYGLSDLNNAAANLELAKKNGFQPEVQIDQKLAEIYLQLKNYQQSASSFENVLSLNDENVYYYIKPIWLYLDRLNQPVRAMALAQKAYKNHPKEAMSFNLLGWAAVGNNRLKEAEDYLNKAKTLDPHLDAVYLNFGLLNEKKGDLKLAGTYYKQAFDMGKGNSISSAAADSYNRLIGKIDNLTYSDPVSLKVPLATLQ